MNNSKMISIILCTYNGERFIGKQLESILNQTYNMFEVIVIDDCSSDNTVSIINSYEDTRVKVFRNEKNLGCAKSFEKGIVLSKGEYIVLCDQDDYWFHNKLSVLKNSISIYDLVYSDCELINANGDTIGAYSNRNKLVGCDSSTENFSIITAFNSFILGCSIMFKRDIIEYVIPIGDVSYNHDKWIVYLTSLIGKVYYVDEKLFQYRLHDNNLSMPKKITNENILDRAKRIYFSKRNPLVFSSESMNAISLLLERYNIKLGTHKDITQMMMASKIIFMLRYIKYIHMNKCGLNRIKYIILDFFK